MNVELTSCDDQTIRERVQAAGVVGAGGAGFPTHIKLQARVDTFLVNAAEFEFFKGFAQAFDFSGHVIDGALIFFLGGHQQQVLGIGQALLLLSMLVGTFCRLNNAGTEPAGNTPAHHQQQAEQPFVRPGAGA